MFLCRCVWCIEKVGEERERVCIDQRCQVEKEKMVVGERQGTLQAASREVGCLRPEQRHPSKPATYLLQASRHIAFLTTLHCRQFDMPRCSGL